MRFYKRDPDAALSGMSELTLQERGAYNTIIDLLYARDGMVQDNDEVLRRVMGCHGNEWRAVKAKLIAKGKVWVEGGFIKAKRVDDVLREAAETSNKQRQHAIVRWENARKHAGNGLETPDKSPAFSLNPQSFQHDDVCRPGNAYIDRDRSINKESVTSTELDIQTEESSRYTPNKVSLNGSNLDESKQAVAAWNAFATQHALPQVQRLTTARRTALRQRLKEAGGLTGFETALAKAAAKPWMLGQTTSEKYPNGWRLNFDTLCRQGFFTKLIEGVFDEQSPDDRAKSLFEKWEAADGRSNPH